MTERKRKTKLTSWESPPAGLYFANLGEGTQFPSRIIVGGTLSSYLVNSLRSVKADWAAVAASTSRSWLYIPSFEHITIQTKRLRQERGFMKKAACCTSVLFAVCLTMVAQDPSYYKAIEKAASTPIQAKEFKQLEQDALKDYSRPESYEKLATAFGNSTEKVWAVIYGEVFCNVSPDADHRNAIGSLVYQSYEKSLSSDGGKLSVNLTENAQSAPGQVPFESQFEIAFLMAAAPLGDGLMPLSVQKLTRIRKSQLSLWNQKKLPSNELMRWQQTILAAGNFDAYNYWLFQSARPDEFKQWTKEHQEQYQTWLDWLAKNKFQIQTPDFQRLYLLHGRH